MSDRSVPFDEKAVCDNCGSIGAYDFMGDFLCPECFNKQLKAAEKALKDKLLKEMGDGN